MLSGLPVIRSWLLSSRPTSLLLSGEPVYHLALGCAVLRRGMAREEKRPHCFLSPWGLLGWHLFAPAAAFLNQFLVSWACRISTMAPFAVMALNQNPLLKGTWPFLMCAPLVHPRKFWLTSPHPCQWLVNNFIPTYKFFIIPYVKISLLK